MPDVAIFGNFAIMVKLIGNMANVKHVKSLIVQTFFDSFRLFLVETNYSSILTVKELQLLHLA